MGKFEDLTGQTFGYLLVLEYVGKNKSGNSLWRCRCLCCGNEVIVAANHLKSGQQSCGCLKRKGNNTKHGMSRTKIYHTWGLMMYRCYNPNAKGFDRYGGRGIKVCDRWHDFNNFYEDVSQMENFGRAGYTLDRIDVNGDYCPENVRWADRKTQQRNTRANVKVEYEGVQMCLIEAAEKSGINYRTLQRRYYAGDRGDKLFRPVEK